jgi:hypothetical protein
VRSAFDVLVEREQTRLDGLDEVNGPGTRRRSGS